MLKMIQKNLGFTDEEMAEFKRNPRNLDVIDRAPEVMKRTIVAEVVESHGCNSRHKKGDRFYFDGGGNLLTAKAPSRVCIYALEAFSKLVYAAVRWPTPGPTPTPCASTGPAVPTWAWPAAAGAGSSWRFRWRTAKTESTRPHKAGKWGVEYTGPGSAPARLNGEDAWLS